MKRFAIISLFALLACTREAARTPASDTAGTPASDTARTPASDTARADTTVRRVQPAAKAGMIELHHPFPYDRISSPLVVEGIARGGWYFEASFPVYLVTAAGDTIARVPAQAEGEWMTSNFVPFKATLEFAPPAGDSGTLILEKSNASGLPEHADELRVPIRFR